MGSSTNARRRMMAALGSALLAAVMLASFDTSQAYAHGGGHAFSVAGCYGGHGGSYYGGAGRYSGGGGRYYGGGACDRGGRYYGGSGRYYDGGGSYFRPYGCRYDYPRSYVSFGVRLGSPVYRSRARVYRAEPAPVYSDPDAGIDVENDPPAGCYYYDPFCNERFSNLDDYTEHIQSQRHARTIDIIDEASNNRVRTLEFVNGEWSVKR